MTDLFHHAAEKNPAFKPLAERMRPETLDEILGQEALLGSKQPLRRLIERGQIPSMILWGPPGCGKTTLARVLAQSSSAHFESLSAVMSGVKELREAVARASERRALHGTRTLLFIDEIHRFNKAQQDALLPHVESGLLTLVGATTENPSFEVNAALLSRARVMVLKSLSQADITALLQRSLVDPQRGLGKLSLVAQPGALEAIAHFSQGDARRALGLLEASAQYCCDLGERELRLNHVEQSAQHKALLYDKNGDEHYQVVSAFIKSMRGSDANAAVYWMTRMLEAGESPRFILRRMVIFASEDIGNADPQALVVATAATAAFEFVGMPEGVLPLTQAATYLATAPKSNAVLKAYGKARADVAHYGSLPVPLKLRNAATSLMKTLGFGKDYKYPHNFAGNYVEEQYLPDELAGRIYYDLTVGESRESEK